MIRVEPRGINPSIAKKSANARDAGGSVKIIEQRKNPKRSRDREGKGSALARRSGIERDRFRIKERTSSGDEPWGGGTPCIGEVRKPWVAPSEGCKLSGGRGGEEGRIGEEPQLVKHEGSQRPLVVCHAS